MGTPDDIDSDEFTGLDDDTELDGLSDLDIDDDDDDGDDDLDDLDYSDDDHEEATGGDDEAGPEPEPDDGDGDDEVEDEVEDDDEVDDEVDDDEEPDEEEESLDVILAREQDLEDEFAPSGKNGRTSPTSTPAGEGEFTCRSCFLVKKRAQLADEEELICLDCA